MTHKQTFLYGFAIIVLFALVYFFGVSQRDPLAGASTIMGNDYNATSTAASAAFGAQTTSVKIKTGAGTLASVIITGANTGVVNFYDATTTNVSLRAPSAATSTILIASFPASTAAGDYIFDAEFSDGLYMDLFSGNMPTTTITWR